MRFRPFKYPAAAFLAHAHRLFLLTFTVVLLHVGGVARAEEIVCTGANLIAELAEKDPHLLEKMKKEAAAIPNGEGLLWRVERQGGAPSYLFGTMHVTDPRVTEPPEVAKTALAGARTVVIETTDILDRQTLMAAMLAKPELMMFPTGESLTDHLSPEERKLVEEALEKRGIPLQSVVKTKPWLLVSLVSLPECELKRQQAGALVLDAKLAQDAKAAGKRVAGLETVEEQLSAMASLPMELHMRGLVGALGLGDRMDDMIETMIVLYEGGETGMFRPALSGLLELGEEEAGDYAAFEETMVQMRNRIMAERAAPLLDEGGAFIAVGAMHLPGEGGIIELLRQAGYEVSRAD